MARKKKIINHYSFDKSYRGTDAVVIGLDLSLRHSGIIVMNGNEEILHKESIVVLDRQKDKKKYFKVKFKVDDEYLDEDVDITNMATHTLDHYKRILAIKNRILFLVKEYGVSVAAIEGYSYGSFKKGVLAQIAESSGLVKASLSENNIPFYIVPPKSLKVYVSGNGNASKEEMQHAILKKYFLSFEDDNEADAYGFAVLLLDLGEEVSKFCEKRGPEYFRLQKQISKN